MITIRNATPEDAKIIQTIRRDVWLETYPSKEYNITKEDIEEFFRPQFTEEELIKFSEKRLKDENQKYFIAEEDGRAIGICGIMYGENFNSLNLIYVLPEYQGKGIGTMLWNECLKHFDKNKKIIIHVAVYNEKAIKFYEKLGFKDTGKRFTDESFMLPITGSTIPEMEMEAN